MKSTVSLLAILLALACCSLAQESLSVQFADPTRFVAAHGRRAWTGGFANSGLEVWAGALQIVSDVHPEFRRAGDVTAISGETIVSRIKAEPSHFSRTYTGPDFSAEEQVWVPLDKPAAVIRYIIRSLKPVQVIVRFRPSLNLMWPAALGGQEIRWQAEESAYWLTDSARQFGALVLAPGAEEHDEPLNSARPLPQTDELAVALNTTSPEILFARLAPGTVPAKADVSAAQGLLQSSTWQRESAKHFQDLLASRLEIETPDGDLNRALAWSEIALDQAWECNELLGCGYVAGYGPSRRNRRPQYAWFFAGDGMIALHAAMAEGDIEHARDELRFIAKYQDAQTGMIWHELSQSAPYIDWRGKYPYMFVHADLAYPYISAVADYVRNSNDRELLRDLWPSVQEAFAYGRSLIAADGLPRIPEGKEGGDEQNPLKEEIGLSASWVAACLDYAHLATLMGQTHAAEDAQALAAQARAAFSQRYWDVQRNFPIQAYRRNGEPMQDRGLGAIGAINQHLFNNVQIARVLDAIASWRFQSDWGTRSVAMGEAGFDPTGYAHGSVWALGTADVAQAYWSAHRPDIAWEIFRSLIPWTTLDAPGHMHEVLAGDTYHAQLESVPEQTWSSASFLTSAVRGLFGLDTDLENGAVNFAPHLPGDWDHASVNRVRMGSSVLNLALRQETDKLSLRIENSGAPVHMRYDPAIPLGARLESATACGRKGSAQMRRDGQEENVFLNFLVPPGTCEVVLRYRGGVSVIAPGPKPTLGNPSSAMKLTDVRLDGNVLHLGIDAIPSRQNAIELRTTRSIQSATEAQVHRIGKDLYEVDLPRTAGNEYQHFDISIRFAP